MSSTKGTSATPLRRSKEAAKYSRETKSAKEAKKFIAKFCQGIMCDLFEMYMNLRDATDPHLMELKIIVGKEILDRGLKKPL